jgi:hypothetical protein
VVQQNPTVQSVRSDVSEVLSEVVWPVRLINDAGVLTIEQLGRFKIRRNEFTFNDFHEPGVQRLSIIRYFLLVLLRYVKCRVVIPSIISPGANSLLFVFHDIL